MGTDNRDHICLTGFTSQRVLTQKMYFVFKYPEVKNMPVNNNIGNNTARNKTTELHKYMPYNLIHQFATLKKPVGAVTLTNLRYQEQQTIHKYK